MTTQLFSLFLVKEVLNLKGDFLRVVDDAMLDLITFDNDNINMAQARLSVFKDQKDWLLTIETVAFDGDYKNIVNVMGSNYNGRKIFGKEILSFPEWPVNDEGEFIISPYDMIHVKIQGEEVWVRPTQEDYQNAGIEPDPFGPTKLLRLLCYLFRDKFWIHDKELFQVIGIEKEMPLFFRTEHWRHPDVMEKPSQIEFFQQLDSAIAKNDPSIIEIKESNTHWSNWTYSDQPDF